MQCSWGNNGKRLVVSIVQYKIESEDSQTWGFCSFSRLIVLREFLITFSKGFYCSEGKNIEAPDPYGLGSLGWGGGTVEER